MKKNVCSKPKVFFIVFVIHGSSHCGNHLNFHECYIFTTDSPW